MIYSEDLVRNFEVYKNLAVTTYKNKKSESQIIFLNELKEKYKRDINSPRTYEYINDLETLFKILEKRNVLTPVDIQVLEFVYRILKINTTMLENHKILIQGESTKSARGKDVENQEPNQNKASFRHARSSQKPPTESASWEKEYPKRQRLSERVISEISTRVGASWESLARYLKVQEREIHLISQDPSLRSYEAKARAMLQVYEKQSLPEELKIKLLKALRLQGRMDIQCDVEKLFFRET